MFVSGVGFLNVPRYPDWPGLDDFTGPKFHTSRWEHHHDLAGKIGRRRGHGLDRRRSSSPPSSPSVGHLYLFQREPGWVMPKGDRDFTDDERTRFSNRLRRRQERLRLKWLLEKNIWGGEIFVVDTKENAARTQLCLDYIARVFEDRPDLQRGGDAPVPVPGQAADLRVDVLPRAQGAQRRAGAEGGGVGDAHRHRRRRRRRARRSTSS